MIKKLLIANRGEIALRIHRAAQLLGIKTVAVHSKEDRHLKHVLLADESICIGPNQSAKSYLNIPALISACELSHANAVHPGYGFLSENFDFVEQLEKSGYAFVGPRASVIQKMGNKIAALKIMKAAGVPTVPGSGGALPHHDDEAIKKTARAVGYPVLIKAAAGGGGRGMSVVHQEEDLIRSVQMTRAESKTAFGSDEIYLEKYLENPRHIEVQVLSDHFGHTVHLGTRDCSIQRRHQKIIEESPALDIDPIMEKQLLESCIEACHAIDYRGAGTLEFLYENGRFYFIEMNTRLQVEHPVTEAITGIDLVKEQLKVASNIPLTFSQKDITFRGHSIECRINAEHPRTFVPSPGRIDFVNFPGGKGVRVDSHIYHGYNVPSFYDSLIAKIITHSAKDRSAALKRMQIALDELLIRPIETNTALHVDILKENDFQEGSVSIHWLENYLKNKA